MSADGRAALDRCGEPERAARRAGRAVEQRLARGLVERRERRLEQLADEREREVALQLGRTRGQHAHAGCATALARGLQQARLAEPGGRLDDASRPAPAHASATSASSSASSRSRSSSPPICAGAFHEAGREALVGAAADDARRPIGSSATGRRPAA